MGYQASLRALSLLAVFSLACLSVVAQSVEPDISASIQMPVVNPYMLAPASESNRYSDLAREREEAAIPQPPLPGFTRFGGEFSAGVLAPTGALQNSGGFKNALMIGGSFHFRPHSAPRLQLDLIGLDMAFDAIKLDRRVPLTTGEFRNLYDLAVFVNSGARYYLTDPLKRFQASIGGGGTYAVYAEYPQEQEEESINCTVCQRRNGAGGYLMGQVRYRLSPRLGLGFTTKYYIVRTKGDTIFGSLPNRATTDRWLAFMGTLSIN